MGLDTLRVRLVQAAEEAFGGEAASPDALTLLKQDHETVKQLFEEALEGEASSIASKRATIERILQELELHAKLEETLFYPAVKAKSKRDTKDRLEILEAAEEHDSMKVLMRKIQRTTGRDETLRAKVKVLKEIVEHHVEEEESELFAEARRLLGEKKLQKIGAEIRAAKERAARRGLKAKSKRKPA